MNIPCNGQHSTLVIEHPDPTEEEDQLIYSNFDDGMECEENAKESVFTAYQEETDQYNETTENMDHTFRSDLPTVVRNSK